LLIPLLHLLFNTIVVSYVGSSLLLIPSIGFDNCQLFGSMASIKEELSSSSSPVVAAAAANVDTNNKSDSTATSSVATRTAARVALWYLVATMILIIQVLGVTIILQFSPISPSSVDDYMSTFPYGIGEYASSALTALQSRVPLTMANFVTSWVFMEITTPIRYGVAAILTPLILRSPSLTNMGLSIHTIVKQTCSCSRCRLRCPRNE
jgi:hypothetical protein